MFRPILITGCSAGGKSTLLDTLANSGFATVKEPGRRIVQQQINDGETRLLPWIDLNAFANRALALAAADLQDAARHKSTVFLIAA